MKENFLKMDIVELYNCLFVYRRKLSTIVPHPLTLSFCIFDTTFKDLSVRGRHGRIVVGFTITYAIRDYI